MATKKTDPFAIALKQAEKSLDLAVKQRESAIKELTRLAVLIPNLETTVSALKNQLKPGSAPTQPVQLASVGTPHVRPANDPGKILLDPLVSRDVPEGAGVILAAEGPAPQEVPDLDSLPGMKGGGWG